MTNFSLNSKAATPITIKGIMSIYETSLASEIQTRIQVSNWFALQQKEKHFGIDNCV